MELQTVSFIQAKLLKELGFNWNCGDLELGYGTHDWNTNDCGEGCISAPTIALALKWCRDVKGIVCAVELYGKNVYKITAYNGDTRMFDHITYYSYDDAEKMLLDKILKILQTNE